MDLLSILSLLILVPAFFVGYFQNPIYSVLSLIVVFLGSAVLLLILEVEFLAMVFIVVYVGAIAVLFLFVVMMLNIKALSSLTIFYHLTAFLFSFGFAALVLMPIAGTFYDSSMFGAYRLLFNDVSWINQLDSFSNIQVIGQVLYSYLFVVFILAGFVLLVAMLGSIVLTLHHKKDVRRQAIYNQVQRDAKQTVKLVRKENKLD